MKDDSIQTRLLCLRGGMSQQELANELEKIREIYYPDLKPITRNDIANWETSEKKANKRTTLKASDAHILALFFGEDCDYIITGKRAANKTISADLNLSENAVSALKGGELGDDISFLCDRGEERIIHFLCEIIKDSIILSDIDKQTMYINTPEISPDLGKESGIKCPTTAEMEKWIMIRQFERIIEKTIERLSKERIDE